MANKGNYYRKKSIDYYRKLGYEVRQAEVNYMVAVGPRKFFKKFDIGAADLFAWSAEKNEWILVNAKYASKPQYVVDRKSEAKTEFAKQKLPACVKKQVCIWQTRKAPLIFEF